MTVTVSRDPSPFWPTGMVTVHVTGGGTSSTRTANLGAAKHGVVTLTITLPSHAGTASVCAVYGGSARYAGSTSATQTVQVT